MKNRLHLKLLILLGFALGSAFGLTGCNAVDGLGEDMQNASDEVEEEFD